MDAEWKLAKTVFQQAIELPASHRIAFVKTECNHKSTQDQVLKLLDAHFNSPDFLNTPFSTQPDQPQLDPLRDPLVGRQIDGYYIQRRIGIGGMGAVYEATQSRPSRQVAIKVLRHDIHMDDTVLRRFKNESQLLAQMQHPNIAHVYESGTFVDEQVVRPWFAMEWVNGMTLNRFLEQHTLSREQKLQLMLVICEAVSHAHSKGIVHRDLKPGNILVQSNGTEEFDQETPNPKIVDFGIARATESNRHAATQTHSILGTLNYLSPEQVTEDRRRIDHRCDVYSLGVVAFEMLTGKLPFDRTSGSITNVLARIGGDETRRLNMPPADLPTDLRTLLAKALAFDPQQRYQTALELAQDIRHFLRNEPINARPTSVFYRTSKFIRRNKILVGGATTTILALLVGMVSYAVIADRAKHEAANARYESRKAVAVNSFVTNDFLTRLLNNIASDSTIDIETQIDSATSNIETIYAGQPVIEAAIRNEVGTIYYNVNAFQKAAEQYQSAWNLWEPEFGPLHADTLKAINNLAQTQIALGNGSDPATEALCRQAYQGRVNSLGATDSATLRSLNNLAEALRSQKRFDEAETLYQNALQHCQNKNEDVDRKTVVTLLSNLGSLYASQRKMKLAIQTNGQAHAMAKNVFGLEHPVALRSGIRYAQSLDQDKQYSAAAEAFQPILNGYEQIAENNPAAIFVPYRLMARIHRHQGDLELARTILNRAMAVAQTNPEKFKDDIKRIAKDLKRIENN